MDTYYERLNTLKRYKPTVPMIPPTHIRELYEKKIRDISRKKGFHEKDTNALMFYDVNLPFLSQDYLNYLHYRHLLNMVNYVNGKLDKPLTNIPNNIRKILLSIIKEDINESYYLNTIDIYESISNCEQGDLYPVIDQAIRLNNRNLLYYLYFREDLDFDDKVREVIWDHRHLNN